MSTVSKTTSVEVATDSSEGEKYAVACIYNSSNTGIEDFWVLRVSYLAKDIAECDDPGLIMTRDPQGPGLYFQSGPDPELINSGNIYQVCADGAKVTLTNTRRIATLPKAVQWQTAREALLSVKPGEVKQLFEISKQLSGSTASPSAQV
jgi:hypothetical protein